MTTEEHNNLDEGQNPVEEDLHDEKDSSVEAEEAVSEESVDDEPGHTQARATVVWGTKKSWQLPQKKQPLKKNQQPRPSLLIVLRRCSDGFQIGCQ